MVGSQTLDLNCGSHVGSWAGDGSLRHFRHRSFGNQVQQDFTNFPCTAPHDVRPFILKGIYISLCVERNNSWFNGHIFSPLNAAWSTRRASLPLDTKLLPDCLTKIEPHSLSSRSSAGARPRPHYRIGKSLSVSPQPATFPVGIV
jgi:hypothetical protein